VLVVANCAVEDPLSESVLHRCLEHVHIEPGATLGREGCGYLKRLAPALNRTAAGIPYVMLTDLDAHECVTALLTNWIGSVPMHPHFLLCVAVREVEAWVLADRRNLAKYLGISLNHIPRDTELIQDPKHQMLMAARRSRYRRIREDIVAESSHGPVQGPDYNGSLSRFVATQWDLSEAANACQSLSRLMARLGQLRERLQG
jgi:hypothetical protein